MWLFTLILHIKFSKAAEKVSAGVIVEWLFTDGFLMEGCSETARWRVSGTISLKALTVCSHKGGSLEKSKL